MKPCLFLTFLSDGTLTTQVYRKPTYTGLYLRWDSFVPKQYKIGLVKCLIHRAWHICSCSEHFSQEMDFVKSVLMKNGYPQNFINSIFKKFLQSKYTADIKYPVFGPQKKSIYFFTLLWYSKPKISKTAQKNSFKNCSLGQFNLPF